MRFRTACIIACLVIPSASLAADESFYITPYLQNVTPTSITVMWETREASKGGVEFGQGGKYDRSARETEAVKIHEVHLTGLTVLTTYEYRVVSDSGSAFEASFTTAPEPGTDEWRLVVYGDNRSDPNTHRANVEQILKLEPGIVLNSGDLVANGKEYSQWKEQYFDPMRGLAEYVPIYPCMGNHEKNADHYYNYSAVPDSEGEVYYSFDYANAHIIALNSNRKDAPFQRGEAQTEWLIAELKANQDKDWIIVFFHHPLFRCHPTRGIEPQRWVWQPIFDEYGVDLVVNGHDHYYQRTYAIGEYTGKDTKGVYHLVSGGGGANTYPITPKIHAAARRRVHHVTALDVMGDRIVGRAIDIDGTVFDSFVIDKQATNSAEEFISYEGYLLERELGEAIRDLPVNLISESGVEVSERIEVANPFKAPVRIKLSWLLTEGWDVSDFSDASTLNPGERITIPVRARAPRGNVYPVPTAQILFSRTDGEKAFRNDVQHFYPVRVGLNKTIAVKEVGDAPKVDGDLTEAVWNFATPLTDFVTIQGDRRAERTVEARLLRQDEMLYVSARIAAPTGLSKSGYDGRDNRKASRNDHFRVHIGSGDRAYTFLVTAKGTEMDVAGGNTTEGRKWNSSFHSAIGKWDGGWLVEMAVPLNELGLDLKALRINLARRDVTANTEVEMSSTFGRSGLDHHIPMYQGDWEAVKRFAALKL